MKKSWKINVLKLGPLFFLVGLICNFAVLIQAQAEPETVFIETVGIGLGGGLVLGASTLPFYNHPENHMINLAYGASLGAIVGVGFGLYYLFEGNLNHSELTAQNERETPVDTHFPQVKDLLVADTSISLVSLTW